MCCIDGSKKCVGVWFKYMRYIHGGVDFITLETNQDRKHDESYR